MAQCADRPLNCCQVVEGIEVEERFVTAAGGSRMREYRVRLRFAHPDTYPPEAGLTFEEVLCPIH